MNDSFTVGSLYAGIGGIDKGFIKAGYKVLWANENDPNSCITYEINFPKHKLSKMDIWKESIDEFQNVDVIVAGFPCQAFSIAGYRKGFDDKRGNHFYRIAQIVKRLKPKVLFLENVKNFQTHDKGRTWNTIAEIIEEELQYKMYDEVLNTMYYGNLPQTRERWYAVCFKKEDGGNYPYSEVFRFPKKISLKTNIQDIICNGMVEEKYYYREDKYMYQDLVTKIRREDTVYQWRRVYVRENKSNVCPTLTANMGTGGHNVPLIKTDYGIRKLTPKECFMFQGYNDIILPEIADSHLYKQAGNSVSVPVISRIASKIKEVLIS